MVDQGRSLRYYLFLCSLPAFSSEPSPTHQSRRRTLATPAVPKELIMVLQMETRIEEGEDKARMTPLGDNFRGSKHGEVRKIFRAAIYLCLWGCEP